MSQTKHFTTGVEYKDDGDTGSVVARFSTFDIIDREGDIVRASAFTDGQSVPMVWAHDWTKPIGKGVVRVAKDHARFEGEFFPTSAGQEARSAVKAMGDLQQYSWGFRVLETQPNEQIRGFDITAAEVFEVSPVLVGANQQTATLSVKALPDDALAELQARMADMRRTLDELVARSATPAEEPPDTDIEKALIAIERERIALELVNFR